MVSANDIAQALGKSYTGVITTMGRWIVNDRMDGDEETAITASVTRYYTMGIAPFGCALKECTVRAKAVGVGATTTIDVLKAASGTAVTSGTQMITQVQANALTANTNYKCAVSTSTGAAQLSAGDAIVLKVVSQGGETLTPPTVMCVFE